MVKIIFSIIMASIIMSTILAQIENLNLLVQNEVVGICINSISFWGLNGWPEVNYDGKLLIEQEMICRLLFRAAVALSVQKLQRLEENTNISKLRKIGKSWPLA